MWSKKLKRVLAKVLVVGLLLPNLSVKAETKDTNIKSEEKTISSSISQVEEEKSKIVDVDTVESKLAGQEYNSKKINVPFVESKDEYFTEKIEYKLKMEALKNITVLETKTDSKYEVALAHDDGTFTYVSSVESMEEAMNEVKGLSKSKSLSIASTGDEVLPTIIDNKGQVVYSTNSMARIIKYINGQPYGYADKVTNLYSDSTLIHASTYINQMYVDDAPILQDVGTAAKILVSGTEAWINKDTSKTEYDMIVVPLNQVKNPSYYKVENGDLKHYITYNLKDTTASSGYTITVGKAPSYLSEGVRYLSYDGIYFYNGQDIEVGLNNLISDYKASTRGKAVNSTNPFYLYFKYLPFRSKTAYTSAQLDKFIADNTESNSKLRGIGSALKSSEDSYGVNAVLSLGIAINESAWGMSSIAQTKNNLFGINAVDSNPGQAANEFTSPSASVVEFTKNYISRGYADPADWRYNGGFLGNKKDGTNVKYASDPFWGEKASQFAYRVDKYLSGSISALKDNDFYQLAMATTNNKVMKSDGSLLYNITNDKNQYSAYVDTPFIITQNSKMSVGGQSTYEINPERTTPLNNGGTANKFIGTYDWNIKGYVVDSGIKFMNEGKGDLGNPVTSVSLDKTNIALKVGDEVSLVARVMPEDATNKNVTWKSSDNSVATVDGLGKIKVVGTGVTTITVTTVDGGKTASCKITVAPSIPGSVKASSSGYNSIKTSWGAVSGTSGYQIYTATSSAGPYKWLMTTTGTSYNNTGLTTGTTYYYKVRAFKTVGSSRVYSSFSSVVSAKPTPSVPGTVKSASSGYNSIKTTWNAVSGASGYQIYTATSSAGPYKWLMTTTGTSYNNTGLTAGKTYYYKVRAFKTVGSSRVYSSFSSVVSAKPIPSTPGVVKAAKASATSIKVTWGKVSGASGYQIYTATSSSGPYKWLMTTTGTSYNNTGLTTGKTYYYKVRAFKTVGSSRVYSNFSSVVSAKL